MIDSLRPTEAQRAKAGLFVTRLRPVTNRQSNCLKYRASAFCHSLVVKLRFFLPTQTFQFFCKKKKQRDPIWRTSKIKENLSDTTAFSLKNQLFKVICLRLWGYLSSINIIYYFQKFVNSIFPLKSFLNFKPNLTTCQGLDMNS